MVRNSQEILTKVRELKHYKYWFGAKGQIATVGLAGYLKRSYPNIWTSSYYNRAMIDVKNKERVGDCSFLVCHAYEMDQIGSAQIAARFTEIPKDGIPDGAVCWRPGHVGIYEKGRVHELSCQAKDYRFDRFQPDRWEKILISPNVEYVISEDPGKDHSPGWHKDNSGWWYATGWNPGEYYHDCFQNISGKTYYFDHNGYIEIGLFQLNGRLYAGFEDGGVFAIPEAERIE